MRAVGPSGRKKRREKKAGKSFCGSCDCAYRCGWPRGRDVAGILWRCCCLIDWSRPGKKLDVNNNIEHNFLDIEPGLHRVHSHIWTSRILERLQSSSTPLASAPTVASPHHECHQAQVQHPAPGPGHASSRLEQQFPPRIINLTTRIGCSSNANDYSHSHSSQVAADVTRRRDPAPEATTPGPAAVQRHRQHDVDTQPGKSSRLPISASRNDQAQGGRAEAPVALLPQRPRRAAQAPGHVPRHHRLDAQARPRQRD